MVAMKPDSSALRRCRELEFVLWPVDVCALHLCILGDPDNIALSLAGQVAGSAVHNFCQAYDGDTLHVVVAEAMAPWFRAS